MSRYDIYKQVPQNQFYIVVILMFIIPLFTIFTILYGKWIEFHHEQIKFMVLITMVLPIAWAVYALYLRSKIKQSIRMEKEESSKKRYERVSIDDKKINEITQKLTQLIGRDKLYLNPDLHLEDIAKQMGESKHHLTFVLNQTLQKNFYQYVNEFRIEEVISRMKEDFQQKYSILAIAFDSGFGSKSSFNRIFKEIKGKTPSEYRKNLMS